MRFRDRCEAGEKLAEKLLKHEDKDIIVYALPRGGVVLGYEIAKQLGAPLDLVIVRKIGHPGNPEYAVCAVDEEGEMICNEGEKERLDEKWLMREVESGKKEARRRREKYVNGVSRASAAGKTAIIVDDGIATGLTFRLAIEEIRRDNPKEIIAAVPVAPKDIAEEIEGDVDEFVCLDVPAVYLGAVGTYYDNFEQVSDEEVIDLLTRSLS